MSYEPNYRFFCLPVDVNIDDYVETIDWGNDNLEADTVLPLTTNEVEYYHAQGLWHTISEQTGELLEPSEDDSIHDIETIEKVYDAFLNMDTPKDKNIEKMIYILKYAIDHNRDLFIHI